MKRLSTTCSIPARLARLTLMACAAACLAAAVAACSRGQDDPAGAGRAAAAQPASAYTPQPAADADPQREAEWMEAIHGNDYDRARRQVLQRTRKDGAEYWQLSNYVSFHELADGQVAVIVNASPSDAEGGDQSDMTTGGTLNVYRLARKGHAWAVLERREGLGELGSYGHMGSVRWVMLAPGKPGFVVSSHSGNRGHARTVAHVFDLAGGVRFLGGVIERWNDADGCSPTRDLCVDADGVLRFADAADAKAPYRDLVIDYTGKRYTVVENERHDWVERPQGQIKEAVRYRFDGKTYVLAGGTNPLPQ